MDLDLIQFCVVAVATFGIVYVTIPILIKVAYLKDLYDKPDGDRKLHTRYVPTLGGIALFIAFFVGYSITGMAQDFSGYPYFAAAMILLFFTGLKDDLIGLSPTKKLLIEVVAGLMLIFGCDVYISNFHGMLGIQELPYTASVIITLFTLIVVINAYNLIDGVDGLAGSIGLVASLFFGIGFYVAGSTEMAAMSFILCVTLFGFLLYNFKPASIFMGDTGSLIVGFLLSVLAIQFIGLSEISAYSEYFGLSSAIIPVAILIVPLYDTFRVFYRRAKRNTSPFLPGKDHVHHELLRMGFGHSGVTILLSACTAIVTLLAVSITSLNQHIILGVILLTSICILPTNGTKRSFLSKLGLDFEFGPNNADNIHSNADKDEKERATASESIA